MARASAAGRHPLLRQGGAARSLGARLLPLALLLQLAVAAWPVMHHAAHRVPHRPAARA